MGDIISNTNVITSRLAKSLNISDIANGTMLHQMAEAVAQVKTDQDNEISRLSVSNSLLSATGLDLDNIGNNTFGIPRLEAKLTQTTAIYKTVKFYVNVGTFGSVNVDSSGTAQAITIPSGTPLYGNANGIAYSFATSEEVVLAIGETEHYVPVKLMSGDFQVIPTGAINRHSFTGYASSMVNSLLVTNSSPIATGRGTETDDNYRYRLFTALKSTSSLSPQFIKNQIQDLPGVSYCEVTQSQYSGGTFTVYVQGVTPMTSGDVLDSARGVLASVIPPWSSDYTVTTPNYIGLEIAFNVTSTSNDTGTMSQIINSVTSYVNNYNGSAITVSDLLTVASSSVSSITDIAFAYIHVYTGDANSYRTYDDYTDAGDVTIDLDRTDKLIIESVPNAVQVYFIQP